MKKIFDFGKIDFDNRGKVNSATLEVELKDTPDGEEFTACGNVWNARHSDIVAGGQCLDEMAPFFKNNKLFNKLYKFWKLYHLNGMHPECEHQHAQKWHEIAGENVIFKIYKMTVETIDLQNKTQRNIKSRIIAGETVKATPQELEILKLNYTIKTTDELPENIKSYYKLDGEEIKAKGWLDSNEHPEGLLCKPCPVCGYKYGTSWKFFPIPAEDLAEIKTLLGGGDNENK